MQYVIQCIAYNTNYSASRCLMQQVIIICAVVFWSRFSFSWSRFSKTLLNPLQDYQVQLNRSKGVLYYVTSASFRA